MAGHGPGKGYITALKVSKGRPQKFVPTLDWVGNREKFLHCSKCGTDYLHRFERCPFCQASKVEAVEVER
jgi:uncharacterized OB-fold protein